jgi:hypothetical protein
MTTTERLVLRELTKSLSESAEKNFTVGDVDKWYDFAQRMKSVIETTVPILDRLTGDDNPIQE